MPVIRLGGTPRSRATRLALSLRGFKNSSRSISPGETGFSFLFDTLPLRLVVICDLNLVGMSVFPAETDSKLIVDPNTVLTGASGAQRLESIAWGTRQVPQCSGDLKLFQLAQSYSFEGPKVVHAFPLEQSFGV